VTTERESERLNPRPVTPNTDGGVRPNPNPSASLFESMGSVADDMRQIATDLGARPYRVFSIVLRWSGGEVGKGTPQVVGETEYLPTPMLTFGGVRGAVRSAGRVDRGNARLSEVSPRYTEDEISALFHVKPLAAGMQAFIESRIDERDGQTQRRRYVLAGPPWRDVENFQWVVPLQTEDAARSRSGEVRRPRMFPERRPI
jgi:hypothetical protein